MSGARPIQDFEAVSPEVLVATGDLCEIGDPELDALVARLAASPRGRVRLCAHRSPGDPVHEMLIAIASSSYVRPHRHRGKSESFHIVRGEVDVVIFDDEGGISRVVRLGGPCSGRSFYYRLSAPRFHTLLIRSEVLVMHETTTGPFRPQDALYAAWSPEEADEAGVAEFVERLAERVPSKSA